MKKTERQLITAFLLLYMAFLSAIFAVQGSLLTSMIDNFHLDPSRQGLANSMAFLGGILALAGAFSLQGRWKKRTLLKIAVVICAAGLMVMWAAKSYALYVAGWFIAGFGLGLMDTLLSACMADLYTGRMAVIMMCMLHTAYGLSSVLSPMGYAAMLNSGMLWQRIYLVIAMAGLLILLGAFIVKKAGNITDREVLSAKALSPKEILPALHKGGLIWLTVAIFFHGIFLSGLNTWANRYADGLGGNISLPAQSCVFFGVMVSRMLMPFLPVKPGKYVAVSGFVSGALLLLGLFTMNGWLLRLMLIASCLIGGAMIPCVITLGCDRQRENTLLATTGIMLALYLGQGLSSPLIAALEGLMSLKAGMALCAVCMAVCSLCCCKDAAGQK